MLPFEELKLTGLLPSPPGVGMRILRLTDAEDFCIDEISRTIQSDPALTGRVLKYTNAARSQGVRPITTIDEAIVRLGVQSIRTVVLGFSLISEYSEGACKGFDYAGFWSESLARAVGARKLSECLGLSVPAEAYSIGLLAGVGRLAFASVHPDTYSELLMRSAKSQAALLGLEQEAFAIDHGEVAEHLLMDWGLPAAHCRAVRLIERETARESEESSTQDLVAVVRLATRIAEICVAGGDVSASVWARVETLLHGTSLSADDLINICDEIVDEWRDWAGILDVDANDVPSFAEIRNLATAEEGPASPAGVDDSQSPSQPLQILAVDDERVSLRLLAHQLRAAGHEVREARGGKQAFEMAMAEPPDIIVTDWRMPEMDGIDLCRTLRQHEIGRGMYIIMLTSVDDENLLDTAFESEIDDYLTKPFNPKILQLRVRSGARVVQLKRQILADQTHLRENLAALAVLNRRLEKTTRTDELTQLPNRRHAMQRLSEAWARFERTQQPFALIMADLDRFKRINDEFGHDTGDVVLRDVGRILADETRESEFACRLGGEEFLILCDGTEVNGVACAERIREAIEGHEIRHGDFDESITISLGVAVAEPTDESPDDVLKRADEAVYEAKHSGRNRVVVFGTEPAQ